MHDHGQRADAGFRAAHTIPPDDRPVDQRDGVTIRHAHLDTHARKFLHEGLGVVQPVAAAVRADGDSQARLPRHVDLLMDLNLVDQIELGLAGGLVIEIKLVRNGWHLYVSGILIVRPVGISRSRA